MMQASVSQSVERTIRIFALFEKERRPLGRAAIAEALDAPRSSIAALLQGMTELDILSFDRRMQTYFPTVRLGRLTGWIDDIFSVETLVADAMSRLRQSTRETVTLVVPLSQTLEVVRSEPGVQAISYTAHVGQMLPLWSSAAGFAWLSTEPDRTIAEMHRRARSRDGEWPVPAPLETIMEAVRQTRRDGYALYVGSVDSGVATIASPLRHGQAVSTRAIALSGPSHRILQNTPSLAQLLRDEITALSPG